MSQYDSLVDALADLSKRGFTHSFDMDIDHLYSKEQDIRIHPEEFEIVEFYRFEGMNDPDDSSIVYAIESKDHNLKGVLVTAYGAYSDGISTALIEKQKFHL
jgi:hypothetical protein